MILGTVQLGTNYGIHNKTGKPAMDLAFEILDIAYKKGIRILDTGPMYGNAEEIIGQYFNERGTRFFVSTKLPDHIPDEVNPTAEEVKDVVRRSLDKLGIDKSVCYYLHQFYQCKYPRLMDALCKCKREGLIEYVGVSIYHPEELKYICENLKGVVDVVQIPYNIFSALKWREALALAQESGIKIFSRSIFLQGLAFMKPDDEFAERMGASEYIRFVQNEAGRRGESIAQLCYDIVAENPFIEDILFGCETKEQLLTNLLLEENKKSMSDKEMEKIGEFMCDIPLDILDPQTWGKYR